ncbi:unnamed protein product [Miscanthus lutarioriparius]|uniref:FAD/NAD(P)-binding oxidoreductase family protein n=1 Tax=Miscanthus lutarioriparius TaxID=422564 RepID=A0A811RI27_9POAL|nr:unnamed protein product [Miscanthus lutarioriparius]
MPPPPIAAAATALPVAHLARVVAASGSGGATPPRAAPRRGRRGKPGFSRRSAIKKSFHQEQVVFSTPVPADPTVAVIGGGASGLSCASALAARGVRSVVFDTVRIAPVCLPSPASTPSTSAGGSVAHRTGSLLMQGMHGLGGRMATRFVDGGEQLVFDHAAQFFTASDERFQRLVDEWLDSGLVREWSGLVGELEAGGRFRPIHSLTPRYIGVNGMRPLADAMLPETDMIKVLRPCWISKLEPFNGLWRLFENEKPRGEYDAIVIAHNDPLPVPRIDSHGAFEGAFVRDVDSLSWMGNNTRKLFPMQTGTPECWTLFSTAAYGKRNKVPQENIPKVTAEKVKEDMLGGVEHALGLSKGSLQQPIYTRVQLWGAALPMNTPGVSCIFDPLGRAGICGDWLTGSSIEAAVLSGMSLANHIADYFVSNGDRPEEFAIGLHEDLNAVEGHDIGQFPGD